LNTKYDEALSNLAVHYKLRPCNMVIRAYYENSTAKAAASSSKVTEAADDDVSAGAHTRPLFSST